MLFTAHFAWSHAIWLGLYPLTGYAGANFGMANTMAILGSISLFAWVVAWLIWPKNSRDEIEHDHADLPADHPHLKRHGKLGDGQSHSHPIIIDNEHPYWPTKG